MLPPLAIHYVIRMCPICARTKSMLKKFELRGLLNVIEVDIQATLRNDIIDRYNYFVNRVLGGQREVPVILINNKNWYMPRQRSRVDRQITYEEIVEKSISDLENEILKDIRKTRPEPEPFHSHKEIMEKMAYGI